MDGADPTPDDPLGLRPWGIDGGYFDGLGTWREPSHDTASLIRRAMGSRTDDPAELPPPGTALHVVRPGATPPVGSLVGDPVSGSTAGPVDLVLEDGTHLATATDSPLPPDLPLGYHRLVDAGGTATNLVVAPERCHLPPGLRDWGLTVQLYAARSSRSWGHGDLADLHRLARWAERHGAGAIALNPLHAPTPLPRPADSPYSPSSRRWRNPLYLAVEALPGLADLPDRDRLVTEGRALNGADRIDRTAVWAAKRAALEQLWDRFPGSPAFDRYRSDQGPALTTWATFCALADHHGTGWRAWPAELRRPDSPAVARFAAEHPRDLGFWAWLQWLLDEQLAASGAADLAIGDLAVGIDPDGADAWEWQDLLAEGVRIGAPPDPLGREGQDWGLPPFVPWRLRDQAYGPLAATLRAGFRHARGLRIDHVMGLFRLLWIPPGRTAVDGAYVRFPGRELLDVVALESVRAGGLVVGEDLGTVEPGVRELLSGAGVLSTRLLWFEDAEPEAWPAQAMAAVTTHDLPTVAGVWSGADLADQRAAGVTLDPEGDAVLRHRLRVAASCDDDAPVDHVVVAAHRRLAASPCALVTVALDDLVGAEHRPNLPGTVDEHPNWRIPLPVALDDLAALPLAEQVAEAVRAERP